MDGTGNSRNPIFLAPRGKLRGPFVFSIPKQNRVGDPYKRKRQQKEPRMVEIPLEGIRKANLVVEF